MLLFGKRKKENNTVEDVTNIDLSKIETPERLLEIQKKQFDDIVDKRAELKTELTDLFSQGLMLDIKTYGRDSNIEHTKYNVLPATPEKAEKMADKTLLNIENFSKHAKRAIEISNVQFKALLESHNFKLDKEEDGYKLSVKKSIPKDIGGNLPQYQFADSLTKKVCAYGYKLAKQRLMDKMSGRDTVSKISGAVNEQPSIAKLKQHKSR